MMIEEMGVGELAAYICTHLKKHEIGVVLSGDSCVSIYTDNKYQADDLDFVENESSGKQNLIEAMGLIGFSPENKYGRHFNHPSAGWLVEFPSGPLMVGSEPPAEIKTLEFETGELSLLSPTDCVKDRLLWFFNDPNRQLDNSCLDQAVMVARDNDIDYPELARWAKNEGEKTGYEQFINVLKKSNKTQRNFQHRGRLIMSFSDLDTRAMMHCNVKAVFDTSFRIYFYTAHQDLAVIEILGSFKNYDELTFLAGRVWRERRDEIVTADGQLIHQ